MLQSSVHLADEVVDLSLVVNNVGFEVGKIKMFSALSLRENEVKEEKEAEPRVEWHPTYNEESPRLSEEGQSEHDEVDQPWCCLGWIA